MNNAGWVAQRVGDERDVVIGVAMTTSNDRLDRIEALVERNAKAIDKLTDDNIGRSNERLDTDEKFMRWMMQLAFTLLFLATAALILNAAAFLVRLLLLNQA